MINITIHFNPLIDAPLFDKLIIRKSTPAPVQVMIQQLNTIYWTYFAEESMKRSILGFEFAIDTGKHTPACCKKSALH